MSTSYDRPQGIVDVDYDADEHQLQQILNAHIGRVSQCVPFIERYKQGDASIHIHNSVRPAGNVVGWDFCTVLKGYGSASVSATFKLGIDRIHGPRSSQCKTSVFVDVRERNHESREVIDCSNTGAIVGLHSLNDCVRFFGNPRKVAEYTIRERRCLSRLEGSPEGKRAVLLPLSGKSNSAPVLLDEIECEMIEGRPKVIDDFIGQDSNREVRLREIECRFAVRLRQNLIEVTAGISLNALLERTKVLICPEDFEPC